MAALLTSSGSTLFLPSYRRRNLASLLQLLILTFMSINPSVLTTGGDGGNNDGAVSTSSRSMSASTLVVLTAAGDASNTNIMRSSGGGDASDTNIMRSGTRMLLGGGRHSSTIRSSNQPDYNACVAPLETLLDCLPFAQGKEAAPTPSCCKNVKEVFQTQKICLCELIAVSFQRSAAGSLSDSLPPFNSTLALQMPSACNVPADPSMCPALLGIPPSSPEAKEFQVTNPKANGTNLTSSSSQSNSSATGHSMSMKSHSPPSKMRSSMPLNLLMGATGLFYQFVGL